MPGPFDSQVSGTTRFPVIDTDPHTVRVVRYFRPRDYATWATVTAGFPAAYFLWGRFDPMPSGARGSLRKTYTLAAVLGAFGGFFNGIPKLIQTTMGVVRKQKRTGSG